MPLLYLYFLLQWNLAQVQLRWWLLLVPYVGVNVCMYMHIYACVEHVSTQV